MRHLHKGLSFTALALTAGLLLTGCTSDKPDAASLTPGAQISSAAPTPTPTPLTDKEQVATSAAKLFDGLFHTPAASAKKIITLNNSYEKTDKTKYIKQIETYVPSMRELQHVGQSTTAVADAEYALTALTMSAVVAADPAALKKIRYVVDPDQVKILKGGETASLPQTAVGVSVDGQVTAPTQTQGANTPQLQFSKENGKWALLPKAFTDTK